MQHSALPVFCSRIGLILSLFFFSLSAIAQPAILPFSDCTSGNAIDPSHKINISTVYGQITTGENLGRHLNLTVIGNTGQEILPISNQTGLLSTLFTTSTILSFNIWQNSTFFCSSLRPPSPLTANANDTYYFCPVEPGPVAFSAAIPLGDHQYELLTINTRLRIVDTSSPAIELGCVDIATTPLNAHSDTISTYGSNAEIIFWFSVALVIGYWVVVGLGRISAAWGRGGSGSDRSLWSRLEGAGYILASAISGEKFSSTPALLRFSTPSMRDVFFHTQFCAVLGMVAVQWPVFAYPLLTQTAWSVLIYNITVAQDGNATSTHWNPLRVQDYNPPSDFADQLNDSTSAIFVDASVPNALLTLPTNSTSGMETFAAIVGVRPQDLFGICLVLFLAIVGATMVISLIIWGLDHIGIMIIGKREKGSPFGSRSPAYMPTSKDTDKLGASPADEDATSTLGHFLFRTTSIPFPSALGKKWWKISMVPSSLHGSILHGNLVRILILFHLPLTVFSSYQFANAHSQSSLASVILACVAFVVFSVGIPIFLIVRLFTTATNKLYDETRTLMTLGPLYNHYGHGSQLFACIFFANNLIYGIVIGCGQKSGTAQAVVILVAEVLSSLGTSVWLPWGRGATMGLISFFFCVARITVAVLLVILSPTVSVGITAGSWVAAAILFVLGLIYLAFFAILAMKILEGLLRIIGRIPFDRSKYSVDSGILGALGLMGCCGSSRRRRRRRRNRQTATTDGRSSSNLASQQPFILGNGNKDRSRPSSSQGPPSVLRPEQALRPYKEDSDDESGYIMGSWQERAATPSLQTAPRSGFARVGGGRARYDSPYAIQHSSAGPSKEPARRPTPSPPPSRIIETPVNRSSVTVNHAVASGLPPGAMSPAQPSVHVRTKSQTAIIEDASALFNLEAGSSAVFVDEPNERLDPPAMPFETDDSSSDAAQPKRSHWFPFRRNRRLSDVSTDLEPPVEESNSNGGRSFMVIRNKQSTTQHDRSASEAPPVAEEGGRRSFVVLRGNNNTEDSPSGALASRRLSHA